MGPQGCYCKYVFSTAIPATTRSSGYFTKSHKHHLDVILSRFLPLSFRKKVFMVRRTFNMSFKVVILTLAGAASEDESSISTILAIVVWVPYLKFADWPCKTPLPALKVNLLEIPQPTSQASEIHFQMSWKTCSRLHCYGMHLVVSHILC